MQKKITHPYSFQFTGGLSNTYLFTTIYGAAYAIKFKPTPYLFKNNSELADQVYELVIELLRSSSTRSGLDPFIAVTIVDICKDFFADKERILLYICETADARHMARVRKFDAWFREFKDSHFVKIDVNFPDVSNITYYMSLIFRWNHPQRHTIIDEFESLAQHYNTNK